MSHAQQVNFQNFEHIVLASAVPVIVDFYADWCGPCRMLGPILDRVQAKHADTAKIVKVNVDEEPDLASHFNVSSIPHLVFINNGEVVGQATGLASEDALNDVIHQMHAMNQA